MGEYDLLKHAGKIISNLFIDPDFYTGGGLKIEFDDGSGIMIYDAGQDCCEYRFITTDDDLKYFIGSEFRDAISRYAIEIQTEYGKHEIAFLVVFTSWGECVCETHNKNNGYYGGFSITVEEYPKE